MDGKIDNFILPSQCTVDTVETLKDDMVKYLHESGEKIMCCGSEVNTIDGAGMQLLLAFYKTAIKEGKKIVILEPSSRLQEIIYITGADKVFAIERGE